MFRSSLNQLQHLSYAKAGSLAALSASLSAATLFFLSSSSSASLQQQQQRRQKCMGIIETNLMEKIANKPYLNYHHIPMVVPTTNATSSSYYAQKSSTTASNDDEPTATTTTPIAHNDVSNSSTRPKGVPKQLRILTIDVPQFRNVFDRECHVDMTMVYPDGIAPPKRIIKQVGKQSKLSKQNQQETQTIETMDIVQKSLVKSLSRCGNNDAILLEASVQDLNPKNLQRRISFRNSSRSKTKSDSATTSASTVGDDSAYAEEIAGGHVDDETYYCNEEMDAPWNQHAWAEELKLRISGGTTFDAPMRQSSVLSRLIFGNCYRRTIGRQGIFQWLWRGSNNNNNNIDDEDASPVASNKPHAVIADGEAMQRVPGSLRELLRCCRNADVPLYIVNDPRIWGSNTHADLPAAASALRKTVKNRTVASALRIKEGSTFHRGRQLGTLEATMSHELREKKKSAKRAIEDARKSLKRDSAKVEDWSQLSQKDLQRELIKRKVVIQLTSRDNVSGSAESNLEFSKSFVSLCNKCVTVHEDAKDIKIDGSQTEESGHSTTSSTEKPTKTEQKL